VKRYRRQKKQTLALAVGLSKLPVLPQKLLEELLPGVSSALFKGKIVVRKKQGFNPKLGDWQCRFCAFLG
jgi:hypothetical protein